MLLANALKKTNRFCYYVICLLWMSFVIGCLAAAPVNTTRDTRSYTEMNSATYDALMGGDQQRVLELVDSGEAAINTKDRFGRTPLMHASLKGYDELAKVLIAKGAYVNAKDNFHETALMKAAKGVPGEVGRLLIDNGANIASRSVLGQDAFMYALIRAKESLAKLLIERGMNVNAVWKVSIEHTFLDLEGMFQSTSLEENSLTIVERLMDWSQSSKSSFVVEFEKIKASFRDKITPLVIVAERNGNIDIAKELIERGADVNFKTKKGATPLMLSIEKGYKGITKLLVESGADINFRTQNGKTPLMAASANGNIEVVKIFVGQRVDINAKDNSGRTALFFASSRGKQNVTDYLLEAGAVFHTYIKEDDEDGSSSSMTAMSYRTYAMYLEKTGDTAKAVENYTHAVKYYKKAAELQKAQASEMARKSEVTLTDTAKRTGAAYGKNIGWGIVTGLMTGGHLMYFPEFPIAVGMKTWQSAKERAKSFKDKEQEYLKASEESIRASVECQRIAECYQSDVTREDMAKCRADIINEDG